MSNSPASQVKRYMRLAPSNGSGEFSFSNGNPIIRFSVADTNAMLVGKEMRFCGNIKILYDGTNPVNNNTATNVDRIAGIQSFIQSVSIGSRRYSANVLEVVHNYPRLATQLYANTHSSKGMRTTSFNEHGGVGKGRYNKHHKGSFGTTATNDRRLLPLVNLPLQTHTLFVRYYTLTHNKYNNPLHNLAEHLVLCPTNPSTQL